MAFGRQRRASVTWLDGKPVPDGTAADDHELTGSLCSALKHRDGTLVRPGEAILTDDEGFTLVRLDGEVAGPDMPKAVVAKLREDDVLGWATDAPAVVEESVVEAALQPFASRSYRRYCGESVRTWQSCIPRLGHCSSPTTTHNQSDASA